LATDAPARVSLSTTSNEPVVPATFALGAIARAAYVLGALLLAGEAAVHIQQYVSLLHSVRWVGPLFLVDAAACIAVIGGLSAPQTRPLAALAGVVTSAGALAALVVSYGRGVFGWFEIGFRPPVEVAVIMELGAVLFLCIALGATLLQHSLEAVGRAT
jgi:hypothetical protein